MTEPAARVWYRSRLVGSVMRREGEMWLRYERDWLERGFPISLSLPLVHEPQEATAFFSGLLPEGGTRQRLCRQLRLDPGDAFGLLLAIGRDCAGALVVRPEEAPPEDERIPLTSEDLAILIESQGQALPVAPRPRFSLAGAQDKVAICVDGDGTWLPTPEHPSTHILKFETIKRVCFAEWAAHDLASRLGLEVPRVAYRLHEETPYLRIERYDRIDDGGGPRRLHQEDVAQALGYLPSEKYQQDGGPSIGDVALLLRQHTAHPIQDIASLRDWQLFNYLVGNSDGHAKNLALLYPEGGGVPQLAPFYDLVCIEFLNRIGIRFAPSLAFFVGASSVPEEIAREDWYALAKSIGVPPKRLLARLSSFAEQLPALARQTRDAFCAEHGDNQVYDRFEESIGDRCRWTLAQLTRK